MLPSSYSPTAPTHFIGPARTAAEFITQRYVPVLSASREPWKVIFSGAPGLGKSALTKLLVSSFGGNQWNTTRLNGRQAKTEEVEALCRGFHFKDMFGAYRFIVIEEINLMPADARSRLLTAVDDLPSGWIFAGTTNLTKKEFVKLHEATASRYEWFEIGPPTDTELAAFLAANWPEVPEYERRTIATFWSGNVRGALNELNAHYLAAVAAPALAVA